ncbi:hypothetical protein [Streptomyces sp. V1I6]|uniref:hypothetical protein n=1 Tax=Streptomyces sp. V1I6 TaxID=3042273 RepID=UPI002789916E|nr:hypothetical protein [Streptomyces sp. V1I6]MDQ0843708.1 hypothetical protein [Streptomyces sp. V1I6]
MVVQHKRRGGAVAGLAAMALAAAGGCSDPGAAAEDGNGPAPGRSGGPAAEVRGAADALTGAGSSKARTSMEMASGGTRVTIRGEGGYDFARGMGMLKVVLPSDAAGEDEHKPITELLTSGALYMKNRGAGVPADKWVRVDTTTLDDGNLVTGGATDPLTAAELLRGADQVTYVGDVEISGQKVRHFKGVTDIGRAARVADPHAKASLAAAAKGFARDVVPFDAYLDEAGRLRKVRHRFAFVNEGRTVDVTSTTVLFDFGAQVVVQLPDEKDIYSGKVKA